MAEFTFEGGYSGSMDAEQHIEDRQNGLRGYGQAVAADMIQVDRLEVYGEGEAGTGYMGYIPAINGAQLQGPVDNTYEAVIRRRWGGGRYRLYFPRPIDAVPGVTRELVVEGNSKPGEPPPRESTWLAPGQAETGASPLGTSAFGTFTVGAAEIGAGEPIPTDRTAAAVMELAQPRIEVGMTVWLELSKDGPYKVIAPYAHPSGVAIGAATEPGTERFRVHEDLWLCQDRKGQVRILAAGALTTIEPTSRLAPLGRLAAAAWAKREIALWITLTGLAALVALS